MYQSIDYMVSCEGTQSDVVSRGGAGGGLGINKSKKHTMKAEKTDGSGGTICF